MADRIDPYRSFNFRVEIDEIARAGFSEVSGLTADGDPTDYREGTDPLHVRKLVGLRKFPAVKLSGGYTHDDSLWQWHKNILNGEPDRRQVTIVLRDEAGADVMSWHLDNAWINKIEGPSFKANGSEVAMQSLELVHEGLTLELL